MTKLKTGDRVVPERFEKDDLITWNVDHLRLIDKECIVVELNKLYGTYRVSDNPIDGSSAWFPAYALTPVKPKWEPKWGDKIQIGSQKGVYCCPDPVVENWHIVVMDKESTMLSLSLHDIRPIAPTLEEEIGSILCKLIGGDNYILRDAKADIMALFNRHKEGEGRLQTAPPLSDLTPPKTKEDGE